jgi:hypothetical protein
VVRVEAEERHPYLLLLQEVGVLVQAVELEAVTLPTRPL